MVSKPVVFVVCLAVLNALQLSSNGSASATCANGSQVDNHGARTKGWLKLPKIFNFSLFKAMFKRVYSGPMEEMMRKAIYVANILKVLFHNTIYVKFKSTYYLGVTELSDRSPHELRAMFRRPKTQISENMNEESDETVMIDEDQLEKELEAVISSSTPESRIISDAIKERLVLEKTLARDDTEQQGVTTSGEKKDRDSSVGQSNNRQGVQRPIPNELKLESVKTPHPSLKAIDDVPEKEKNPYHHPPVVISSDRSSPAWYFSLLNPSRFSAPIKGNANSVLSESMHRLSKSLQQSIDPYNSSTPHKGTNKSLIDWRDTNCFTAVKDQHQCNSCWAFAAIAKVEYEYCRQTQHLLDFSEQYLVDCSLDQPISFNIWGCAGAYFDNVHRLINNYGLELSRDIPYQNKNGTCPYSNGAPSREFGIIRPNIIRRGSWLNDQLTKHPSLIDSTLKRGPVIIALRTSKDFYLFAGGIDSGDNCNPEFLHAMILVGRSEEDGIKYFLFKNSLGLSFGESGYYRLSTSAISNCFDELLDWDVKFQSVQSQKVKDHLVRSGPYKKTSS